MQNLISMRSVPWIGATRSSGAFTPASVSGLVEWLDASLITGSDGDPISTWTATAGSNATSSGGNRPLLYNGVVNGKNVLRFSSASSQWISGTVSITGTVLTAFAVFTRNTTTQDARVVSLGVAGTADFANALYTAAIVGKDTGGTTAVFGYRNFTALSASSGLTINFPSVLVSKFDGTNHTIYQDGVAKTSAASSGTFGISAFRVGGGLNNGNGWNGDICEIIIYNTAVSDSDRIAIQDYLKAKWGTI